MAEAPIRAPANRRDNLRIISCPSRKGFRPPWSGIDGLSVLAQLDIELRPGISTAERHGACQPGLSHRSDRLAGQHGLAEPHVDSTHACQNDMIAAASVQDQ